MPKPKTSILFVNVNDKEGKSIHFPTHILLHWKKYLCWTLLLFLLMGVGIGYWIYEKTDTYYTDLYRKQVQNAHQIEKAIDLQRAKETFESIDQNMKKINHFMEERGLKKLKIANSGGPHTGFNIININQISDFYAKDLHKMTDLVKNTPMGFPHIGRITSKFGYRYNPFGGGHVEGHPGLDIAGQIGDSIKVTAAGKVVYARRRGGYGNCVVVQHKNGFKTLYGHLSKILVKRGEKVKLGQIIGELGSTGRSTGPHVHYEIIRNHKKINPLEFANL